MSLLVHTIIVVLLIRQPASVAETALDLGEVAIAVMLPAPATVAAAPTPDAPARGGGQRLRSARRGPRLRPAPAAPAAPGPTASATSPAPPPLFLSAGAAQALRVHDEFPELPDLLRRPGAHHDVTATICVAETGAVTTVAFASTGTPLLEAALATAIRSWRYRPCLVAGVARPFCHDIAFAYRMAMSADP
jgi:outer membrane biosynthesis protein TonB